uniref:RNI-like protein n=2 Tax=Panagrolaimus superbus TaxID=310955 RepID=A0A914XVV8_9BILA
MTSTVVLLDPLLFKRTFAECSLTRLDLSWAKLPGSDLKVLKGLLGRCTQLQYLALENQAIDAEILEIVAKNRDLLVLNLSSCQVIDSEALSLVFKSCNKLKDLNLSWTYPDEATCSVIINEIPSSIEKFAISGMNDRSAFNDAGLIKILSRLPNLSELDIGDNNVVTHIFMLELAKRKNFRKITASRCFGIEPITFTTLKYVRVMNLFGTINNSGYDYMKSLLPNVNFNINPFATIGRSQHEQYPNLFWNEDISEPY